MSVDTGALCQIVDRDTGAEGQAAIITTRAKGRSDVLGAVIDGVVICGMRRRRRSRGDIIRTRAYSLVIHAGGLTRAWDCNQVLPSSSEKAIMLVAPASCDWKRRPG